LGRKGWGGFGLYEGTNLVVQAGTLEGGVHAKVASCISGGGTCIEMRQL